MILPFSRQRKATWHLTDHKEAIEWTIREDDPFHFTVAVKDLYPVLQQHGVIMPRIDPVRTGVPGFDETWFDYHVHFLKSLRREIRNGTFYLERWNHGVTTNDAHRHAALVTAPAAEGSTETRS